MDIIIINMENGNFTSDMVLKNLISLKKQIAYEGIE